MMSVTNLARWIAGLLVVSAVVFAFAISQERHQEVAENQETAVETTTETGAETTEHGKSGENLFGINLENPVLVWGFVVLSVLLAGGVLQHWKPAFVVTVLISGLAAVLDIRETINQFGIANTVAILALLIAFAHAAAAILSIVALRKLQRPISN